MNTNLTPDAVQRLLEWYRLERRDLPWRRTSDPYHIWLSEIMLQQTRVEAVKPYYKRFLKAAPTVRALAELSEEQLMKLWEGLGYYSRARNLQKAARMICETYGGRIPDTYEELLKLPGVGDYTAGAVASIAFGRRVPAVDGNVLRVLARVSGSDADIADPTTKKMFREALAEHIPDAAGDFTQAMIELGAVVCVPNGEARCDMCPLAPECRAGKEGMVSLLPRKSAKSARRIEEKTVFLIRDGSRTVLHKRPSRGLLSGLYELPNVEGHLGEGEVTAYLRGIGFDPLRIERMEDAKHIFTHIEWHMIAYAVTVTPEFDGSTGADGLQLVQNEELHDRYAIPSAFSAYIKYL